MARKIECDRCGAEIAKDARNEEDGVLIDLCTTCVEAFRDEFLTGGNP